MSDDLPTLLLQAIQDLGRDAYGVRLRQRLEAQGRPLSYGALYVVLDALEREGSIRSDEIPGGPERGGRSRRQYYVTSYGGAVLSGAG